MRGISENERELFGGVLTLKSLAFGGEKCCCFGLWGEAQTLLLLRRELLLVTILSFFGGGGGKVLPLKWLLKTLAFWEGGGGGKSAGAQNAFMKGQIRAIH